MKSAWETISERGIEVKVSPQLETLMNDLQAAKQKGKKINYILNVETSKSVLPVMQIEFDEIVQSSSSNTIYLSINGKYVISIRKSLFKIRFSSSCEFDEFYIHYDWIL